MIRLGTQSVRAGVSGANVYRFSSKEIHETSGMYYYGYRFYAPNLQRWLNRDPYDEDGFQLIRKNNGLRGPTKGNKNFYVFVVNAPIAKTDPLGLVEFDGSCSEKQQGQVNASFKRGCDKAKENGCFDKCFSNDKNGSKMKGYCNNGAAGVKFSCAPTSDTKHCPGNNLTCGKTDSGVVYLCPRMFQGGCGDFACTIMHELVHTTSDDYDHKQGNAGSNVPYDVANCLGLNCEDLQKP